MRVLAVDYGTKRIGLALSDELGIVAQPLPFVPAENRKRAVLDIVRICNERMVDAIVVGLPLRTDGQEGTASKAARSLGRRIEAAAGLPLEFFDERLTTRVATRVLLEADVSRRKRRQAVDSLAAAVLLQDYLERRQAASAHMSAPPAHPDEANAD